MNDPLKPSARLLVKLGSLIMHQVEAMSPLGHHFDHAAIASLESDPEVAEWIGQMDKLGFLPKFR